MLKKIALLMAAVTSLGFLFPLEASANIGLQLVSAQITYFSPASGTYYPGNAVTSSLRFKNTGTQRWTFWIGYSVQDKAGRWYDVSSHSVTLDPGRESAIQSKTWYVPKDSLLTTGYYKAVMAIWRTRPENGNATRSANAERADAFQVFYFIDEFSSWDSALWSKTPRVQRPSRNRGYLDPANVNVSGDYLRIKFPANTFDGGEISSNALYKYGTYKARIKTPSSLKAVSAFFLHQGVDPSDEITIEIFNDGSRRLWLTSFLGNVEKNKFETILPFDPSAGFHEYRIDYYPNFIDFFVDGQPVRSGSGRLLPWRINVPSTSMKIFVNAWFPTWNELPNPVCPTGNEYTLVDWIQH